ncbi:hypothetical protein IGB42_02729 [Andreprevotia sp. IGB-42]|uniref:Arc family DNA-binding protein n=1 Tax=Andreprevotia sp. IGB-42 TaxID=2497473 RepID=UPI00157F7575|nr:Arc family DNA-binding protein [Andreprevotia sp. IGB-42]KAF0812885.1 hypothetical protein IGB42_02729 [Andreprevotia sp. IGB-42]
MYRSQFRLPWALYETLKAAADKENRSLNREVVVRLQESFQPGAFDTLVRIEETQRHQTEALVAVISYLLEVDGVSLAIVRKKLLDSLPHATPFPPVP